MVCRMDAFLVVCPKMKYKSCFYDAKIENVVNKMLSSTVSILLNCGQLMDGEICDQQLN